MGVGFFDVLPSDWTQSPILVILGNSQGIEKHLPSPPPRKQEKTTLEGNPGSIQPCVRYGNAGETGKTISTTAILWPVKAIFEKRAATVEVDTFSSPVLDF